MTHYRDRLLDQIREWVKPLGPLKNALDFGSGDGFFASSWASQGLIGSVMPVDVVERRESHVKPVVYDGQRLPFADASFELGYAIDVLHHCPRPMAALDDLMRCTSRYLLIKDHTYQSAVGKVALGVLDEIGNRRFGIPSPYRYQREWQWVEHIERAGWRRRQFLNPMRCHVGLLGTATNGLQFMGLWERAGV